MKNYIQSHWGVPLKGRFIDNSSDTLCIILPGVAYLLDRSYLDYAKKIADHELNMDVYEAEYGFQITRAAFDIPTEFDTLANEAIPAIISAIQKDYKRYVIIGKSIGTCLQLLLNKQLSDKGAQITNVFISPLDKTVSMGMLPGSLVFAGLADPLLSQESLARLSTVPGIQLITNEGANHSLDIPGNMDQTIALLRENLRLLKSFIS